MTKHATQYYSEAGSTMSISRFACPKCEVDTEVSSSKIFQQEDFNIFKVETLLMAKEGMKYISGLTCIYT